MGIPGADLGVYIGAYFGGRFVCILGAFLRSCFIEFYK